jgi:uncharacterized lipoprotein YddW (UPF0748 family)
VSAAVVPDEAQAVEHKYQSWPVWAERRILDAVCPMVYTPDARLFRRQVESIRERIAGRQPVWAGVGAYRLALDETIARIRTARSSGVSGVVVFSHESFAPSELRRLREEAFPSVAVGPAATSPDERAVDGQR